MVAQARDVSGPIPARVETPCRKIGRPDIFSEPHERVRLTLSMAGEPDVVLKWSLPFREEDDSRWHSYGLYAYLRPRHSEILYIGKAVGRTILQRVKDPDKDMLFDDLARERNIHGVRVIVAQFEANQTITRELILDVECLLIHEIKPWGNIQSSRSRGISRPGLVVKCSGEDWPLAKRVFRDH